MATVGAGLDDSGSHLRSREDATWPRADSRSRRRLKRRSGSSGATCPSCSARIGALARRAERLGTSPLALRETGQGDDRACARRARGRAARARRLDPGCRRRSPRRGRDAAGRLVAAPALDPRRFRDASLRSLPAAAPASRDVRGLACRDATAAAGRHRLPARLPRRPRSRAAVPPGRVRAAGARVAGRRREPASRARRRGRWRSSRGLRRARGDGAARPGLDLARARARDRTAGERRRRVGTRCAALRRAPRPADVGPRHRGASLGARAARSQARAVGVRARREPRRRPPPTC